MLTESLAGAQPAVLAYEKIPCGLTPRGVFFVAAIPPPVAQAEADIDILGVHLLALHLHAVPGAVPDPHHSDYGYRVYWGIHPPGGATPEAASKGKRELTE
ncbi:MAG: hypothetical protein LBF61_05455, partial [Azoarcus sp.]|nr:hypothetical protein [Azoarcus sp.]